MFGTRTKSVACGLSSTHTHSRILKLPLPVKVLWVFLGLMMNCYTNLKHTRPVNRDVTLSSLTVGSVWENDRRGNKQKRCMCICTGHVPINVHHSLPENSAIPSERERIQTQAPDLSHGRHSSPTPISQAERAQGAGMPLPSHRGYHW